MRARQHVLEADTARLPPTAIEAKAISHFRARRAVLEDVQLTIAAGEIVALVGHNGAGKTTLLECLAAILRPSYGQVYWRGYRALAIAGDRRQVGFLGHEPGLYPELTARENLSFAARLYGITDATSRTQKALERVRIAAWGDRRVGQFSVGMRQRLALARAILHDPPILLLDEPFGSLDAQGQQELETLLRELACRGTAVCYASHDDQQNRRLASRLVHLRAGRVLMNETLDPDGRTHHIAVR